MLQFKLSSTDQRQLDVAVRRVLDALRPEDRADAQVSVLAREGGNMQRQIAFANPSDKLAQTITLLSLPGEVEVTGRLTDEPKA